MATHKELMTSLKFDESFRNALRDYYSYGFKKLEDYEKEKIQTVKNDWIRLNNILFDYLEWSDAPRKKNVIFASLDSVSVTENPFHRLYRFCKFNHNDPMEFFNIIFALSAQMQIAGSADRLLSERLGVDLSVVAERRPYYRYVKFIKDHIDDKIELRTAEAVYLLIAQNETLTRKINIPDKDVELVETILTSVGPQKAVIERNYKKYITFLKNNLDKEIYINKVEKKNLKLSAADECIVIPRKDEKYVQRLFKYWQFINSHTNLQISDNSVTVVYKNKNEQEKKRKKKKKFISGINTTGELEFLDVPISNLDEEEMVQKLMDGNGKLDQYENFYLSNEKDFLEEQFKLLEKAIDQNRELTASQLQCFFPNSIGLFSGDNTAINYRLNQLETMGIVEKAVSCNDKRKVAENTWRLSGRTLCELISKGRECSSGDELDFETAFYNAIDFYTKYSALGICGSIIKDRMERQESHACSAFRFRHEYFMQALNDFNLIDLLSVIEKNKWCEIKYRHGTAEFSSVILCKPIEIRISSATGREYLVFYNPVKRACTNLRLEFIEEIIAYDEADVLKSLERINISKQMVDSDITNSYHALKYMWGVSFSEKQEGNVINPVKTKNVKITIRYDEETEYYIKNRLLREARCNTEETSVSIQPENGVIIFSTRVSDPKEMRPWIRSLYSRILNIEGVGSEKISLSGDIEKCIKGIEELKEESIQSPNRWTEKSATLGRINNGEIVREHETIFNEIFGVYYYIIAEIILCCCSHSDGRLISREKVNNIVKEIRKMYSHKGGIETERLSLEEIIWLLENNAFGKKNEIEGREGIEFKYECETDIEFYKNILPLTTMEVRWLKMILADGKIRCFFSETQIEFMKAFFDDGYPNVEPLQKEYIINYDRHVMVDLLEKAAEQSLIPKFIKAINQKMLVDITYVTQNGSVKNSICFVYKKHQRIRICISSG